MFLSACENVTTKYRRRIKLLSKNSLHDCVFQEFAWIITQRHNPKNITCRVTIYMFNEDWLPKSPPTYKITYGLVNNGVKVERSTCIHRNICRPYYMYIRDAGAQTRSRSFFYFIIFYIASASKYLLQNQDILFLSEVIPAWLEQSQKWKNWIYSLRFFVSS